VLAGNDEAHPCANLGGNGKLLIPVHSGVEVRDPLRSEGPHQVAPWVHARFGIIWWQHPRGVSCASQLPGFAHPGDKKKE
jgi:hypothetical protein